MGRLWGALVVAALALAGCGGNPPQDTTGPDTLRVGLDGTNGQFVPIGSSSVGLYSPSGVFADGTCLSASLFTERPAVGLPIVDGSSFLTGVNFVSPTSLFVRPVILHVPLVRPVLPGCTVIVYIREVTLFQPIAVVVVTNSQFIDFPTTRPGAFAFVLGGPAL